MSPKKTKKVLSLSRAAAPRIISCNTTSKYLKAHLHKQTGGAGALSTAASKAKLYDMGWGRDDEMAVCKISRCCARLDNAPELVSSACDIETRLAQSKSQIVLFLF